MVSEQRLRDLIQHWRQQAFEVEGVGRRLERCTDLERRLTEMHARVLRTCAQDLSDAMGSRRLAGG